MVAYAQKPISFCIFTHILSYTFSFILKYFRTFPQLYRTLRDGILASLENGAQRICAVHNQATFTHIKYQNQYQTEGHICYAFFPFNVVKSKESLLVATWKMHKMESTSSNLSKCHILRHIKKNPFAETNLIKSFHDSTCFLLEKYSLCNCNAYV